MSMASYRCTAPFDTMRALCFITNLEFGPVRTGGLEAYLPGWGSSARTLVVRVLSSTSVPTQVILPVAVLLLACRGRARDGKDDRLPKLDLPDVPLEYVNPEPEL